MIIDKYSKKFQKYLLGEALKGNNAFMDPMDYKADETCWLSDGKVIKAFHKDETFLHLTRFNLTQLVYKTYGNIEEIPEPYQYCKVKGIKNLCLKINDDYSVDSKYLQFFDLDKSDLYFDASGVLYIKEDDLISGCILCIKGGQSDESL